MFIWEYKKVAKNSSKKIARMGACASRPQSNLVKKEPTTVPVRRNGITKTPVASHISEDADYTIL